MVRFLSYRRGVEAVADRKTQMAEAPLDLDFRAVNGT
jgi:hypothetical protein